MNNNLTCKIDEYGNKVWYMFSKKHREDGPAFEYADGDKYWYYYGRLHRVDGPAIEYANGTKEWWLNGQKLTQQQFNRFVNKKARY